MGKEESGGMRGEGVTQAGELEIGHLIRWVQSLVVFRIK